MPSREIWSDKDFDAADDLAKPLDTPHGKVEFVTLIGATDAELRSVYEIKLVSLRS